MDFAEVLRGIRVVPVVEIPRADDAIPLVEALLAGGLPCAEITFRTAPAGAAIAAIAAAGPDFVVGAGTVLTVAQADEAIAAGAKFLVAPNFDAAVVGFAHERGVPLLPGVCTPSEIGRALRDGVTIVKLFPAEAAGGVAYLRAIAAPFAGVRFVPTGGIGPENVSAYLAHPQVLAVGGSWMVKKQMILAGDFAGISARAAEAAQLTAGVTA